MTFYQKYVKLCSLNGKTPSAAALEMGLSKAAVNGWKTGRSKPTDVTKSVLAEYFGCPLEYLENDEAPTGEGERLPPEIVEIMKIAGDDPAILKEILDYAKFKKANR